MSITPQRCIVFKVNFSTFDGLSLTVFDVNPGNETNFDEIMYESRI